MGRIRSTSYSALATPLVTLDDIRRADERIRPAIRSTPLLSLVDGVWVKAECLQHTGSFKLRGAYNALASLHADRLDGVVAHSSGNHARAVAHAARSFGVGATIVMPSDGSAEKRAAVAREGAEVVVVGPASHERAAVAHDLSRELSLPLIPSSESPEVIAGQGTLGVEIIPDLDARPDARQDGCTRGARVFVPIGGGGLASGVSVAVRALSPAWTVTGVEPELAADAQESLQAGRIVSWPVERVSRTIADGVRHTQLGEIAFAHLAAHLDGIVTVSEMQIKEAMRLLYDKLGFLVEPSGALSVAAALAADRGVEPAICIVTGGNVDADRHAAWREEARAHGAATRLA